jgi:hypothetical protein
VIVSDKQYGRSFAEVLGNELLPDGRAIAVERTYFVVAG